MEVISDLFDVFGGKDYLRLMCNAKRFRVSKEGYRVSFWVDEDIIRLKKDKSGAFCTLQIQNRKTKKTRCFYSSSLYELIIKKFELATGYSLCF